MLLSKLIFQCHRKTNLDIEMIAFVRAEKETYVQKCREYEMLIMNQLVPKDEDDNRGAVIEVRTGTGFNISLRQTSTVL